MAFYNLKGWRDYFKEFVLLFLAISAGFYVENIRESLNDRDAELEYIRSFRNDLTLDTAHLHFLMALHRDKEKKLDSLIYLLGLSPSERNKQLNNIYYNAAWTHRMIRFAYNDRTIQQLKGAGDLRLIQNQVFSDSIIIYDRLAWRTSHQEERAVASHAEWTKIEGHLINPLIIKQLGFTPFIERPGNNPPLLTNDETVIYENIYLYLHIKLSTHYLIEFMEEQLRTAEHLLKMIQRDYK